MSAPGPTSDRSPRGLRVLWLTEHYHPSRGGMAQSCDRIVHGLRECGTVIDVVHIARRIHRFKAEPKRNGQYIAYPVGSDPAHALNCLWSVLAADPTRGETTHLVGFGGLLALMAGPIYAAWLGVPLVTLIRGNDFDAGIFTPNHAHVVREALERSDRVCVVSREKARKIAALYPGIRPVWIPNGIDCERWEPLPSHLRRAAAWRREIVGPGRRVLGMFGQIKQKKGGLFFLKSLLHSGYAERFHVLLVGDLEDEILEWLNPHKSEIAHTVYPFTDRYDLLAHYPACDLVVIPSLYDGLPNVLLEAMSLGIPLLASTAGGIADVAVDGQHGFLFDPGDPHDCRRAITLASAAPEAELERMGAEARVLVRASLDSRIETERYLAVLRETERQPPPRHLGGAP